MTARASWTEIRSAAIVAAAANKGLRWAFRPRRRFACLPRQYIKVTERHNTEGSSQRPPQKWGLWLVIESDLRFLSHRDSVRAIERAATRAKLPVKYTQGFNPHPILSLVCPRPVGAASMADLAVLQLTRPMDAEQLLGALNGQAPRGMTFTRAEVLEAKAPPQPRRVDYDAPVKPEQQDRLAELTDEFNRAEAWPVERGGGQSTGKPGRRRTIDLKRLVRDLRLEDGRLRFSLVPETQVWARPGELLEAIGLDGRVDLAKLVRTNVEYDF